MPDTDGEVSRLLAGTTAGVHKMTVDLLGRDHAFADFVALMAGVLESANVMMERMDAMFPPERPLACQAGCDRCCRTPEVGTQPAFAIYALYYARNSGNGSAYDHVVRRLTAGGYACAFLDDGACSIYPARPLACRLFHSFDFDECLHNRFLNTGTMAIEGLGAVAKGLAGGLRELSLDNRNVNFEKALRLLLSHEGVAEQWLAGADVFAACEMAHWGNTD